MTKMKVAGDLRAQRNASAEKFFSNKFKGDGDTGFGNFSMGKPRLAQTDAQIGSLPSGPNTVGGVVGGLKDKQSYQGMKAGGK